jgi:hypothetical protein
MNARNPSSCTKQNVKNRAKHRKSQKKHTIENTVNHSKSRVNHSKPSSICSESCSPSLAVFGAHLGLLSKAGESPAQLACFGLGQQGSPGSP